MSLNYLKELTKEERDKIFSKTRYVGGWLRLMGEQVDVVTAGGEIFSTYVWSIPYTRLSIVYLGEYRVNLSSRLSVVNLDTGNAEYIDWTYTSQYTATIDDCSDSLSTYRTAIFDMFDLFSVDRRLELEGFAVRGSADCGSEVSYGVS